MFLSETRKRRFIRELTEFKFERLGTQTTTVKPYGQGETEGYRSFTFFNKLHHKLSEIHPTVKCLDRKLELVVWGKGKT